MDVKLYDAFKDLIKFYFDSCNELYHEMEIGSITKRAFYYLKEIQKYDDITLSKLSEIAKVSKPTITEVINKFVKAGLVYKVKSKSDGRIFYLRLSEKGKIIASTNELEIKQSISKIAKKLNDEETALFISLLAKICESN